MWMIDCHYLIVNSRQQHLRLGYAFRLFKLLLGTQFTKFRKF